MSTKFICHKDFAKLQPIDVFYKEEFPKELAEHPKELKNRHILYRKKLYLDSTDNALLRITADDRYKLYINGKFVSEGPSPAYPGAYYYNELDVSEYLCKGENTFAIHTYYQGLINRVWVSGDLRQMLWMQLEVDGETVLQSDESFKCHNHTGYSSWGVIAYNTAYAERYDSRCGENEFYKPNFDDSSWENACVYENADYALKLQPTKQLAYEQIPPVKTENIENGIRLDFGRETAGYLYIEAQGKSGDGVIIHYGEELNEDGSVRYNTRANCKYEDKWILSGGLDSFPMYDYKAYRYAELIYPASVEIKNVAMIARFYPFEQRTEYETDNEKLKKILTLCRDTIKYGTQEVFVDCPTREKGQYLGDVSIAARALSVVTGDTVMMKKAITDFCESSFICPGLMSVSTASKMQEIADYSLQFPAQVVWVYSMDKDIEFMHKVEPYVTALYQYMLQYETEDGLIDGVLDKWNLVDWPANLRDGYSFDLNRPIKKGLHNVLNAFWCGFLEAVDEFYSILGMSATGRTEGAKKSFIKHFYSKEKGLFCDTPALDHSAVHSNLLPLLFDIGTEDRELCNRIAELIKEKKLSAMGVYMAYFALAALIKQGYSELALELATDEGCWLNMLNEGATTTFEAWGKEQKGNCSLFHPWATAPLIVFSKKTRAY